MNDLSTLLKFNQKTCSVCQKPLSTFQQSPYFRAQRSLQAGQAFSAVSADLYSCGSFECNNILDKKNQMSAPQFAAFFDFQRKSIQKNKEDAARNEKRRLEKIAQSQAENTHLYEKTLRGFSLSPDQYPLLSLPSCWRQVKKRADDRTEGFIQHLRKLLEATRKSDFTLTTEEKASKKKSLATEQQLNDNPPLEALVIQACTLCQGGCCTQGGNHAYLSAGNIYEYMRRHQMTRAEDIITAYQDKIPSHSIENSCLFHTTRGCNLPREMRSDICNGYLCNGLKKAGKDHYTAHTNAKESPPEGFIAVLHVQDNWQASDSLESNPASYVGVLTTDSTA